MDGSCAICWESNDFRVLKCGHCFCIECLRTLSELRCLECDENHNTIKCPMDRREDSTPVRSLPTPDNFEGKLIPLTISNKEANNGKHNMNDLIDDNVRLRKRTISHLRNVAKELEKHELKCASAKIGGSAAGVIGSIMCIVGISLSLTLVGLPVALPLEIAGAAIATVGGVTSIGAIVTESVMKKLGIKSIEEDLQMDHFRSQQINVLLCRASKDASLANKWRSHDVVNLGGFVAKLAKVGVTVGGSALTIGTRTVSRTVALGTSRSVTVPSAATVCTSTAASFGLHIAGLTFAAVIIPLDLWIMIRSSIKVHKKKPSAVIRDMRSISNTLEEELNQYLINKNG